MIIDHSIIIETEKLRAKINLLFEDCKDMTDAEFIEVSEKLRKGELYGKLPASKDFLQKNEPNLVDRINDLLGEELIVRIEKVEEKAVISVSQGNWQKFKESGWKDRVNEILREKLGTEVIKQKYID
jgi:hypothetical protein